MNKLQFLLCLSFAIITFSCSDLPNTSPRECEYELSINPLTVGLDEDGDPCEITVEFHFLSDTGEEFVFSYDAATDDVPSWTLPAGTHFDMWIVDTGYGSSAACGDYYWDISIGGEYCMTFKDYVEERPDIIDLERPHHSLSTGACKCPEWSSPR